MPAPAVLEILKEFNIIGGPVAKELATPTGCAIYAELCDEIREFIPQTKAKKIAYGAGSKDFDHPNVLRIIQSENDNESDTIDVIETKDNQMYVMEINSGVCLTKFINHVAEGRDIANNVLELWRQRGSAESALLELLEALPSPIHSKTYSRLQKGKLDQGADDWLFDSQREAGDYTILENSSAITIIYISGRDLPCWQAQVEQAASEEQCGQYLEDMKASCSVMCLSGLNHVIDYLNDTYLAHKQVQ